MQRYSCSLFKTFAIKGDYIYDSSAQPERKSAVVHYEVPHMYSAVGHEVFQANQRRHIRDRCVVLPLSQWLVFDKECAMKYTVWTRHFYDGLNDCVAFRTR